VESAGHHHGLGRREVVMDLLTLVGLLQLMEVLMMVMRQGRWRRRGLLGWRRWLGLGWGRGLLFGRRGFGNFIFIQDTDGAIFAYTVRHLHRVHPHSQLRREQRPKEGTGNTHHDSSSGDQRIHLAVDSDTSVTRALERLFRKPVVGVMTH